MILINKCPLNGLVVNLFVSSQNQYFLVHLYQINFIAVFLKLILRRKGKESEGKGRKVKKSRVLETFLGEKGKKTEGK